MKSEQPTVHQMQLLSNIIARAADTAGIIDTTSIPGLTGPQLLLIGEDVITFITELMCEVKRNREEKKNSIAILENQVKHLSELLARVEGLKPSLPVLVKNNYAASKNYVFDSRATASERGRLAAEVMRNGNPSMTDYVKLTTNPYAEGSPSRKDWSREYSAECVAMDLIAQGR